MLGCTRQSFLTGKKDCLARPLRARRRPPRNMRVQAETDRDHFSVPVNNCLQTNFFRVSVEDRTKNRDFLRKLLQKKIVLYYK